jgi:hypothetical protein
MIGVVLAAAAVGAVAGQPATAGHLEVIPSVTVESRVGEAPPGYGVPPEASLVEVLTPGVALDYVGRRLEFRASYDLRIFLRSVSGASLQAPLYLNTVNLTLTGRLSRRLSLTLAASAYEGQADYTYLPAIFTHQAALVAVPDIFAANVSGSAELRATRRVTAAVAVQASHSQPIGAVPMPSTTTSGTTPSTYTYTLPHYTSLAATPGANIRLTRLDTLEPSLSFEYQQISSLAVPTATGAPLPVGSLTTFIVIPTLGMHRALTPRSELTLKVGVDLAHLNGSNVTGNRNPIGPIGSAAFDTRLLNVRRAVLRGKATTSVEYYLDPVLGTAATHFITGGSLYLGLPQSWTIGIDGSFFTSLAPHPIGTQPNLIYPDEVGFAFDLPVRHLLTNDVMLEFGGRWSDRSPFCSTLYCTTPDFTFHQRQLWLYVLLTGTTHPTWSLQRGVAPTP